MPTTICWKASTTDFLPSTTISTKTNHKDMKFEIADQLFCDVKILVNC